MENEIKLAELCWIKESNSRKCKHVNNGLWPTLLKILKKKVRIFFDKNLVILTTYEIKKKHKSINSYKKK